MEKRLSHATANEDSIAYLAISIETVVEPDIPLYLLKANDILLMHSL